MSSGLPSPVTSRNCGVSLAALCQILVLFQSPAGLRVFEPIAGDAGESMQNEVGPAVAVDVVRPVGEAVAVTPAPSPRSSTRESDASSSSAPRPGVAVNHVHLAVMIHIRRATPSERKTSSSLIRCHLTSSARAVCAARDARNNARLAESKQAAC